MPDRAAAAAILYRRTRCSARSRRAPAARWSCRARIGSFTSTSATVRHRPLVLHVATSNNGNAPRFLLSGGVDLPSMWNA